MKNLLASVPVVVWVILGLVLVVVLFWFSDDIGSWWENRKETKFDEKQAKYEQQIDVLQQQYDDAIKRAVVAEAREQTRIVERDQLLAEIQKRGINIQQAEQKISDAATQYQKDQDFIKKVEDGEVSSYELCIKQCNDSAELGYPCIPTKEKYCSKFKE